MNIERNTTVPTINNLGSINPSILKSLRVRPTTYASDGVSPPVNSELRKVANEVLGALKYSFAAVAANPETRVRVGSVEEAFKGALSEGNISAERRANFQRVGRALVSQSVEARQAIFGRAGQFEAQELLAQGVARFDDGLSPLALDKAALGIRAPSFSLSSLSGIRAEGDNLIIPSTNLRNFSLAGRDFESAEENFADQIRASMEAGVVNDERMRELWGIPSPSEQPDLDGDISDFEGQAVLDKVRFEIKEIKCIDETNPEFWGSDEIAIGGVSTDEDGDTKKISESYVGGGFDDGDRKTYSYPYWNFHWFSVTEREGWPKKYVITTILAEKDNGGFASALDTIWKQVRAKVKEAIIAAVGTALAPYLTPFLAQVIGMTVAWIVDALISWIISLWNDDLFPPHIATLNHGSLYGRFTINGNWGYPYSDWMYGYFTGHGGQYRMTYRWRLYS